MSLKDRLPEAFKALADFEVIDLRKAAKKDRLILLDLFLPFAVVDGTDAPWKSPPDLRVVVYEVTENYDMCVKWSLVESQMKGLMFVSHDHNMSLQVRRNHSKDVETFTVYVKDTKKVRDWIKAARESIMLMRYSPKGR